MGRLLILKKDQAILTDFQDRALFADFACAALHADDQYYYVSLIPAAGSNLNDQKLMQRWESYIVSAFTPVHGSSRQPSSGAAYQYMLAHYPIVNLEAVRQFYAKHHSRKLDEFMLNYCRRYIDFDFIDAEQQSLYVFSKNTDSTEPLPPIEEYPGADQFPEFLADLHELVTKHLQPPAKLSLLACIDLQLPTKSFSPVLFQPKPDTAPTSTSTRPSLHH